VRDGDAAAVTEQGGSAIKETAYLSLLFVGLNSLLGNRSNRFIVVFVPHVPSQMYADFIMAKTSGLSFVDHQGPKDIRLVISLLFELYQFGFNSLYLFLHITNLLGNKFDFFLKILNGKSDVFFIHLILNLYSRVVGYVWIGK
jgi:hypothetical protein